MFLLHGTWVDLVIIIVLIIFIHQGFVNGFWSILIDFISFFGALVISFQMYKLVSSFLHSNFSFSHSVANATGFLIAAVVVEIGLSFLFSYLINKLPQKILKNHVTKVLGVILSVGQGIILIAFALTLAISLPISPVIKTDISNSKIGTFLLNKTTGIEKDINSIFGGAVTDSLTYLTVEPQSKGTIALDNKTLNLNVDRNSETKMFQLLNSERTTRNIAPLTWDVRLVVVGENYAKLMWADKYFGHYDPEGRDVGDRLQAAGISYAIAGENLALAATTEIAHTGLMNSPGHKANILETRFKKVGIGVIDNGFYGKIFVQVFTD